MASLLNVRKTDRPKKKKSVGGPLALKLKRSTNHRSHVVRNVVRVKGLVISPSEPVIQCGANFAFISEQSGIFPLPTLGYVGGRPEVENIRSRVVADNMTNKEISKIADALERRLYDRFATKEDLKSLATKADIAPLARQERLNEVAESLSELIQLTRERQ